MSANNPKGSDELLDERKKKILQAIIRNYLETGEPVGSRTISKYTDLNLSSATIRNEMADLEELGYIVQPHTSAGRIPSDKGYRFYVDYMMEQKDKEVYEMKEMLVERQDKMEQILKKVIQRNDSIHDLIHIIECTEWEIFHNGTENLDDIVDAILEEDMSDR